MLAVEGVSWLWSLGFLGAAFPGIQGPPSSCWGNCLSLCLQVTRPSFVYLLSSTVLHKGWCSAFWLPAKHTSVVFWAEQFWKDSLVISSFVPRFAAHCSDLWTASLRVEDFPPSNCVRVSPRRIPVGFFSSVAASRASWESGWPSRVFPGPLMEAQKDHTCS